MNLKRKTILIALVCLLINSLSINLLHAQQHSPYELSWEKEAVLLGSGLTLMGVGLGIRSNVKAYTVEDLMKESFDRSSVLGIDRKATFNTSQSARRNSDILMYTSFALPFAMLSAKKVRKEYAKVGVMLVETMLITDGLTLLTKHLVKRPRPFVFNPNAPIEEKLLPGARKSFFSGHTSSTAALSFFTAKVLTDYFPDSKLKPLIWTSAALLPAAVGYFRVKGGKHYFSDVAVGYGVGALLGFLIPHLHKTKNGKAKPFTIHSGGNSLGMTYKF